VAKLSRRSGGGDYECWGYVTILEGEECRSCTEPVEEKRTIDPVVAREFFRGERRRILCHAQPRKDDGEGNQIGAVKNNGGYFRKKMEEKI